MNTQHTYALRLPEAYGPGVMDDGILWNWFAVLRRMISHELRPPYRDRRYKPIDLHFEADLRGAVSRAYQQKPFSLARVFRAGIRDGMVRTELPLEHPKPTAFEARYHACRTRLAAKSKTRAARAWACLLIALGLPVPEGLAARLLPLLAEEIACTVAAEEFSGFSDWTIRTGCLRVFGGYLDPEASHPLANVFVHPPMCDEGQFMDWSMLWSEGDGRDLDGFLLTPFTLLYSNGILRLSARIASYDGTRSRSGPVPSLVVHHDTGPGAPYSLVSLRDAPGIVWGEPLAPEIAVAIERFINGNKTPLLEHWRAETDSLTFLQRLTVPEVQTTARINELEER